MVKKTIKHKSKLSSSEIMEKVINVEELEKRKQILIKEEIILPEEEEVLIKEKQWWEYPMKKTFFKHKKFEGKHYSQYEGWRDDVWIGPYNSEQELNDVIKSYIEETKKPIGERKIENIHSIIIKK